MIISRQDKVAGKFNVTVKGMALEDKGISDQNTIDGFGLNTFGFIWGCGNIWDLYTSLNGLEPVTVWTYYSSTGSTVTTNWSFYSSTGSTVTTNWTLVSTQGVEEC